MSEYLITLQTDDARVVQFNCEDQENVISAAERQGIRLPQQCRNGVCGFCTAARLSGEYELHDYHEAALTPDQRAQGEVLLCRTYPRGDLHLTTHYPYSSIEFGLYSQVTVQVLQKEWVTDQVIHLIVQQVDYLDDLLSAKINAGQYVYLSTTDKKMERAYSIANPSNWTGTLSFFIQLWPEGQFSHYLQQLAVNDTLLAKGTYGEFLLQETGLKPRWFIAGGTGLSPILAMLQQMAEYAEPHPVRLFFGVRHESELFAHQQLAELAQQLPDFQYQFCVSRPLPDGDYPALSVVQALDATLAETKVKPDLYICGSNRLVEGINLVAQKYDMTNVFFERFG
jgi:ferredoxin-NADP reductase/ferredoxin